MPELHFTAYGAGQSIGGIASLAIDAWGQSSEINNSTNLDLYCDLKITFGTPPTTGAGDPHLAVFQLPSSDGTDYPNPPASASGAVPPAYSVRAMGANASATISIGWVRGLIMTPGRTKFAFQNKLGVVLPADATVTAYVYSEQSV